MSGTIPPPGFAVWLSAGRGTRHGDLYVTLRLVMQKLGSDTGCPELALPALGSFLFSPTAMPDIERCDIANHDLLDAVRALAVTVADGALRSVDYKNLGAEELGSVYESLLELHPELNAGRAGIRPDDRRRPRAQDIPAATTRRPA